VSLIAFAALALGADWEAEEALKRFKTACRSADPAVRAAGVAGLARVPHDKTFFRVLSLLGVEDRPVRLAAAKALGDFKDWRKAGVPALLAAYPAHAKDGETQAAILDSLGRLEDESALPRIHASFRERDIRAALAAVRATGALRNAGSIEPLLALMKDLAKSMERTSPGGYEGPNGVGEEGEQQQRLRDLYAAAIQAMQSISKDPWTTHQEWEIWWKRRKGSFKVEK